MENVEDVFKKLTCIQVYNFNLQTLNIKIMGKGDKKSKKGKIAIGSYGKKRKRKKASAIPIKSAAAKAPVEKTATKKEAAPKETVKKESTAKKATKTKKEE